MSQPETHIAAEAAPADPGPDEPPMDFAREEAAYVRESAWPLLKLTQENVSIPS
jgi:hypothetical protein